MEFIGISSLSELIKKAEVNNKISGFNDILNQGLKLVSPEYAQAANAGWVNPETAGKAWETFKSEGLGAAQKAIQSEGQQNAMQQVAKDVWTAITSPQQSTTSSDPLAFLSQLYSSQGMTGVRSYLKQNNIPEPKDFEKQLKSRIGAS